MFDNLIKDLKNHLKINDFTQIITDFEKICDEIKSSGNILFAQEADGVLPVYLLRVFANIDTAINDVTNEAKKKMNTNNSKALTKIK